MIGPTSRYRYVTELEDSDGTHYLDEREPFRYRAEPDNRIHIANEGDTWWGLAGIYFPTYQRACGLWWLICEYQPEPVIDPTIAIEPGATIVIPSERIVRTEVFSEERRRDQ